MISKAALLLPALLLCACASKPQPLQPIPALAEAGELRHWALAPRGVYFVPNVEINSPHAAIYFFNFATGQTSRIAELGRLIAPGPGMLAVSPDET